jgi:hypothetical protein
LEKDVLGLVLNELSTDSRAEVRAKCLYILNGFLKHNKPGCGQFVSKKGFFHVFDLLQSQNEPLVQKSLFLFYNLLLDDFNLVDTALTQCTNFVDSVLQCLKSNLENESILSTGLSLISVVNPSKSSSIVKPLLSELIEKGSVKYGKDFISQEVRDALQK